MQRTVKTVAAAVAVAAAGWVQAAGVAGQGTWESTLQARDLDGDGSADAYYDTALDISWLADANVIGPTGYDGAVSWAAGLNVAGVTGWHLPTVHIDRCPRDGASFWNGGGDCGYNSPASTSDMAHMYLQTLGNVSYSGFTDSYGNGPGLSAPLLTNTGPFDNLQAYGYWFSLDHAVDSWSGATIGGEAWRYSFYAGRQDHLDKSAPLYAWAVHDGDVGVIAAVPEPQTYALMLAGLGAMFMLGKRRRRE